MADIGIYSFVAESVGRKGGLHTDSVKKKKMKQCQIGSYSTV